MYALFKALSFPSPRAPPTIFRPAIPKTDKKREKSWPAKTCSEMLTWPRGSQARFEKTGEIFVFGKKASRIKSHREQWGNLIYAKHARENDNYWEFSISKFLHSEGKITIYAATIFYLCSRDRRVRIFLPPRSEKRKRIYKLRKFTLNSTCLFRCSFSVSWIFFFIISFNMHSLFFLHVFYVTVKLLLPFCRLSRLCAELIFSFLLSFPWPTVGETYY